MLLSYRIPIEGEATIAIRLVTGVRNWNFPYSQHYNLRLPERVNRGSCWNYSQDSLLLALGVTLAACQF